MPRNDRNPFDRSYSPGSSPPDDGPGAVLNLLLLGIVVVALGGWWTAMIGTVHLPRVMMVLAVLYVLAVVAVFLLRDRGKLLMLACIPLALLLVGATWRFFPNSDGISRYEAELTVTRLEQLSPNQSEEFATERWAGEHAAAAYPALRGRVEEVLQRWPMDNLKYRLNQLAVQAEIEPREVLAQLIPVKKEIATRQAQERGELLTQTRTIEQRCQQRRLEQFQNGLAHERERLDEAAATNHAENLATLAQEIVNGWTREARTLQRLAELHDLVDHALDLRLAALRGRCEGLWQQGQFPEARAALTEMEREWLLKPSFLPIEKAPRLRKDISDLYKLQIAHQLQLARQQRGQLQKNANRSRIAALAHTMATNLRDDANRAQMPTVIDTFHEECEQSYLELAQEEYIPLLQSNNLGGMERLAQQIRDDWKQDQKNAQGKLADFRAALEGYVQLTR